MIALKRHFLMRWPTQEASDDGNTSHEELRLMIDGERQSYCIGKRHFELLLFGCAALVRGRGLSSI
jgi:hypothetical protein